MKNLYWLTSYVCLLALALFYSLGVQGQYEKKVIAYKGQEAPGTLGALFESFEALGVGSDTLTVPSGTQTGGGTDILFPDLIFSAVLQSGTGDVLLENNEGIWLYQFNGFTLIARKGGVVPGLPNAYFLNDRLPRVFYVPGALGLEAEYSDTGVNDATATKAFFVTNQNGDLEILIEPGMTVLPGVALTQNFMVYAFNGNAVLFSSGVSGANVNATNNRGIFLIDVATKNIKILARANDPMQEIPGGYLYDEYFSFNNNNPLNEFGQTIYNITGSNGTAGEDIGAVYQGFTTGDLFLFNSSDAGNPTSVFGDHRLNKAGEIAGLGLLPSDLTKETIWRTDLKFEDRVTIATEGDPAPGLPGDQFDAFLEFVLYDDRSVGFLAETELGNSGIWINDATGLHKVAAIGDQAPGLDEGFTFFRVNSMVTNPFKQVAFADLAVSNTDETSGVWIGSQNGLLLLTKRGDTLELDDGAMKIIEDMFVDNPSGFSSRTGQDGHPSNLNSSGNLLFTVNFKDGVNALVLAQPEGLVVNSTGDAADTNPEDGICDTGGAPIAGRPECTLRAAIQEANSRTGKNEITFNIPTDQNEHATIIIQSDLPEITESVIIDGTTQDQGRVEVTTGQANSPIDGIRLGDSKDNTVKGLVLNYFFRGISIFDGTENTIKGNYIGTDFAGEEKKANTRGISITGSAGNTLIEKNLISGNSVGIRIDNLFDGPVSTSEGIDISRNRIGTNKDGKQSMANGLGINISGAAVPISIQENLISGNDSTGIRIGGDTLQHVIKENVIGADSTGNKAIIDQGVRDSNLIGISLEQTSNVIIDGNLIAGNDKHGILIQGFVDLGGGFIPPETPMSQNNLITNNSIGISLDKQRPIGNFNGITIDSAAYNRVLRNEIAGNGSSGVRLEKGAFENTISENFIGNPLVFIFRFQLGGVTVLDSHANQILNNTIFNNVGGITINAGELNNIIQNEISSGVYGVVLQGGQFNKISENSIFNIRYLGIDLDFDGVTANDVQDLDNGTNALQNFPNLTGVTLTPTTLTVRGNMSGAPNSTDVVIEFFFNQLPGPLGHGPGEFHLGTFPVSFDANGSVDFSFDIPFAGAAVNTGGYIAATGRNLDGNTSEFSNSIRIENPAFSADLWVNVMDSILSNTASSVDMEYTIEYGNNGPDLAIGVLLSNLLPEKGRYIVEEGAEPDSSIITLDDLRYYVVPNLAPGESREITLTAKVDTVAGDLLNISTISSGSVDLDGTNNIDTVITDLGNLVVTSLANRISDGFSIGQNYPNPFQGKTTIEYSIPSLSTVSIVVYNINGNMVETLLHEKVTPPGDYKLDYYPKRLPSGLYYYAMESERFIGVKKMILIR